MQGWRDWMHAVPSVKTFSIIRMGIERRMFTPGIQNSKSRCTALATRYSTRSEQRYTAANQPCVTTRSATTMVRFSTCAAWSAKRRQKLRVLAAGVVPIKLHTN
jgi:hypothetical protein